VSKWQTPTTVVNSHSTSNSLFDKQVPFVLVKHVPKVDGQSHTHKSVTSLIEKHGGRVRSEIPKNTHNVSSRQYIVLTEKVPEKGVNCNITRAAKAGFSIVSFEYVIRSVNAMSLLKLEDYKIELPSNLKFPAPSKTLRQILFAKKNTLAYALNKKRKIRFSSAISKALRENRPSKAPVKPGRSSATYYVHCQMREKLKTKSIAFSEASELRRDLYHQYYCLPTIDKNHEIAKWTICIEETAREVHEEQHVKATLEEHNRIFDSCGNYR